MRENWSQLIDHTQLLTSVVESRPYSGCPDWASVGAEAFVGAGAVLLGLPDLGLQVVAAEWWVLQDVQEPSVAVALPVTAAWVAVQAFAGVGPLMVSGQGLLVQVSVAGRQTVASEFEGNLPGFAEENSDQKEVSGLEELPDLVAAAVLQILG